MLVDSSGRELAQVTSLTVVQRDRSRREVARDDWAEAKRQMEIDRREGGSFYTTNEVLEHLKSLETGMNRYTVVWWQVAKDRACAICGLKHSSIAR